MRWASVFDRPPPRGIAKLSARPSLWLRGAGVDDEHADEASAAVEAIRVQAKARQVQDSTRLAAHWKEWAKTVLAQGAGKAHKMMRRTAAWTASPVQSATGPSTAPLDTLAAQRATWKQLWRGSDHYSPAPFPAQLHDRAVSTRRPSIQQVRAAADTFSIRSASNVDGWIVKQISWLSDDMLDLLCTLFEATSVHGFVPKQASVILMPMLPKPAGGVRLIGVMAAFVRIFSRTWVGEARA